MKKKKTVATFRQLIYAFLFNSTHMRCYKRLETNTDLRINRTVALLRLAFSLQLVCMLQIGCKNRIIDLLVQ